MTARYPELQTLLDEAARETAVPGAVVGILREGEETVLTTGVTNLGSGRPVREDTLFMIGSTTKTCTAAALLALAEDGVLDLDEPVVRYLPELELADPVARKEITARHLLTHTAGFLGDRDLETGWGDDALEAAVGRFAELPQSFPPGEVFSYSNTGFVLAGRLAEVLAGAPFEDVVRTRLLEPLGMRDSVFLPWEVLTRDHVTGHAVRDGVAAVEHRVGLGRAGGPAGGLWSSARDQLRWARFFLTGETSGTPPLGDATREAMWRPQRPAALPIEEVGLSWLRTRHGDTEVVRHGGNVGFLQVSEFVTLPGAGMAITVLTNSGGGAALGPRIVDWCVENLAGVPRMPARPTLAKPVERLAEYAGRYRTGDLAIDVTVSGAALLARLVFTGDADAAVPPAFEIAFLDEDGGDIVTRAADPRSRAGRFLRDARGRITMLEYGGRTAKRD
ncbi:serine hydrolase domain-containing protein [Amycolatopsis samaneae]|uniref:Serine hydrolase domain-containing protein n=1 Tax=Amycolatopsis samaneae TaxID=664691 RepID=A0ABW5GUB8_9PSEU